MSLINSDKIFKISDKIIKFWHKKENRLKNLEHTIDVLNREKEYICKLTGDIASINCFLWHKEDKARASKYSDSIIADVKRAIDYTNQKRVNKVEEIDKYILDSIKEKKIKTAINAPLNSETPGSIIDRLSVLALKIYHMDEQTKRKDASKEHIKKCKDKLLMMNAQKKDLSACFDKLMKELFSGKKRLKMYYQFKMYNDPATNPWMKK